MSARRPRLALIGPAFPYRGGNALLVSHIHEALHAAFDITIYNYSLLYPPLLFPGTTQYDRSGVPIKPAPNERLVNSIWPPSWLRVARRLNAAPADLVIFDWWNPFFGPCHGAISALVRRRHPGRILFLVENVVSHEARRVDRLLTRVGLRHATSFLVLSEIVEKTLRGLAGERPIYRTELPVYDCYRGPEERHAGGERQALGFAPGDLVLLFFGYVRRYKGLDVLLEAMPRIRAGCPEAKLLVVGEFYDDPRLYRRQIRDLGLEPFVKIVDQFVPNEEVGRYYAASDLVVLPYRSATQSGILNIAYGLEKPVLVTRVGGLAEFVADGETGLVVEPESPPALAAGVERFRALRGQVPFGANIRRRSARNSFEHLPELFRRILADAERSESRRRARS